MHRSLWRVAPAIACGLQFAFCSADAVRAQAPPAPQAAQTPSNSNAGQVPRPSPLDSNVQVSPEVERILNLWEQNSGNVEKITGKFTRFEYDKVFQVVKIADGEYFHERPDKGRMDFLPGKVTQGKEAPPPITTDGTVYAVQPASREIWICTGKEILSIFTDEKQYDIVEIPQELQGANITDGPLPFLFGMKADKLKQRYLISLGQFHNPEKGTIHLVGFPLLQQERREFQKAEVLLDAKTFMPKAIKLFDPSGNKETVYSFQEHKQVHIWGLTSPFKERLQGLTERRHVSPDMNAGEGAEASRTDNGVIFR